MPLKVRRFSFSILLILIGSIFVHAQTTGDVMRDRVAKAKAFIAVRNYSAAIYELENIRRETSDPTVNGVINVLLVNSYLEQGDYKRAQDFLGELSKSTRPGASAIYFAAASQVVKGAKNQIERYRSLGLDVADPNLPKDAVSDVDKMRETLEKVVEQTRILSKDKTQTPNAMALMEEATNARSNLARDSYDATRWKNEVADAREDLASSRSVVINATNDMPAQSPTPVPTNNVTANTTIQNNPNLTQNVSMQPVPTSNETPKIVVEKTEKIGNETTKEEIKKVAETANTAQKEAEKQPAPSTDNKVASNETVKKVEPPPTNNTAETPKNNSPLQVGSLISFATQKSNPVYPPAAKNMRMTGVVKVELTVDESGQVAEVQTASGPAMLQRAATDAVRKWKFKPFTRDGQATKATGFVSFNFSL